MDIFYIDRKTGQRVKEVVAGEKFLKWMYETKSGMAALELLAKKKFFSDIYGRLQDTKGSAKKIEGFVRDLSIDMTEAEVEDISKYNSFNDFFYRKLKPGSRMVNMDKSVLSSPADGRVFAYQGIDMDRVIQVKGFEYKLSDFFNDEAVAKEFDGGVCIVIRLCPADYHRYHFPDSGVPTKTVEIKGDYYSVNPIALNKVAELYCKNKRAISFLDSDNFGKIAYIEVGATCVGSMIQTYTPGQRAEKGDEKGYFRFGGSTVVLFLKRDTVKVDDDIIDNTSKGLESKVNMGESLGRK
jgi:phosphatidylserine decarboxylase